jgi:hypothetical protein
MQAGNSDFLPWRRNAAAALANHGGDDMKHASIRGLGAALCLVAFAALAADTGDWDGLVEVKAKRLDAAFLLPGADFRVYTRVMMDPVEVAMEKNWLRDYNRDATTLSQRLTDEDVQNILRAARDGFTEVFTEAFKEDGVQLVTTPGPDVLRLRAGVVDLFVSAPDTMTAGRSRTYSMEAGHATLFLEARDSVTGALLGRALDKRETRSTGHVQVANRVTNTADFRQLFKQWAGICIKGMDELREHSPVPTDLQPGQ